MLGVEGLRQSVFWQLVMRWTERARRSGEEKMLGDNRGGRNEGRGKGEDDEMEEGEIEH